VTDNNQSVSSMAENAFCFVLFYLGLCLNCTFVGVLRACLRGSQRSFRGY